MREQTGRWEDEDLQRTATRVVAEIYVRRLSRDMHARTARCMFIYNVRRDGQAAGQETAKHRGKVIRGGEGVSVRGCGGLWTVDRGPSSTSSGRTRAEMDGNAHLGSSR